MSRHSTRLWLLALGSWFVFAFPAPACTIAAFGPKATADHRPILWKNRDVDNPNQELKFFETGRYRFIGNVYAGEDDKVWAGINEVGFGIMNSDAFNMRGKDGAADDGMTMKIALSSCATVDDFARIMDSINLVGRTITANFGVFDSTGMTSMFEAANTYYVRYDSDQDSLGVLVRANFSLAGDTNRLVGKERYERAWQVVRPAVHENRIDARFVIQSLCRDIATTGFNPYPLPFRGSYGNMPSGYVPTDSTICRYKTRSVEVMVGRKPGAGPGTGMMWMLLGSPLAAVPVPVWVQEGMLPFPLDGPYGSSLCDEAIAVHAYIHSSPEYPRAVNTNSAYAVERSFAVLESSIISRTEERESAWAEAGPTRDEALAFTQKVCQDIMFAYGDFWEQFDIARVTGSQKPRPRVLPSHTGKDLAIILPGGESRISVIDASGRRVASLRAPEGYSHVWWSTGRLRPGTYFLRFPTRPEAPTLRFVRTP